MPDNIDVRGPSNFPLRPINGGMIRNLPTTGMPPGSFLRLQNYRTHEYGVRRRGGFRPFNSNELTDAESSIQEKIYDMIYFYGEGAAESQMLALCENNLYRLTNANKAELIEPPGVETFTVDSNTAGDALTFITVTFDAGASQLDFETGYQIFYTPGTESVLLGTVIETTLNGATSTMDIQLSVELGATGIAVDELAGESIKVVPSLIIDDRFGPGYALVPSPQAGVPGYLVICDQSRSKMWKYDGVSLSFFEADDPTYLTACKTISYFQDRLWFGNVTEQDGQQVQRIRWSDAFNYTSVQAGSYVDLPYSSGELLRILPMGSLLILYFEDAIYIGRPTNVTGLPYRFDKMETGNMGLIAGRALIAWQDGHYFVGQDNIYSLSASLALAPIGVPILSESLEYTKALGLQDLVQVEHDPYGENICFLFPDTEEEATDIRGASTRIWRFNYKTRNWCYDECHFSDTAKTQPTYLFTGLAPSRFIIYGGTWEDWIGDDPDQTPENIDQEIWTNTWLPTDTSESSFYEQNTWDNLKQEVQKFKKLYLPVAYIKSAHPRQVILEEYESGDSDYLGDTIGEEDTLELTEYPIWSIMESPDYDYGRPDIVKTVTRMSLKYYTNRVSRLTDALIDDIEDLTFRLDISDSMGYKWKRPTTLKFKNNYNEGKADFRSSGSTFRFKITNGQKVEPFKLSEIVMRVIGRGLQLEN